MSRFIIVPLLLILAISSCKKTENVISETEAKAFLSGSTIAIALNYRYADSNVYYLWGDKLTEPIRMPNINGSTINYYFVKDLMFHKNELYSCGIASTQRGNGYNLWRSDDVGIVWRNYFATPMSSITNNSFTSKINAIEKQGDNLYFAGRATEPDLNFNIDRNQASVWKGYQPHSITRNFSFSENYDIAIQNNDIYTCGLRRPISPEYNQAVFYKNNVLTQISDDQRDAIAKSIKVVNNDVFIAYEQSLFGAPMTGRYVVYLWKNGQNILVSNQNFSCIASDMAIHNGDVYIVGSKEVSSTTSRAVYWKNGTEVELTTNNSRADKIVINNNKVYIVGTQANDLGNGIEAVMWVDGVKQRIAAKPGVNVEAAAIAIK